MPIIGAIGNASEYAYRSNLVESPDPFDFTDLFEVEPGVTYYSEYVKITGLKSSVRVSIQPGASYSVFAGVFDNTNTNSLAFDNNFSTIANFSQDLAINLRYRTDRSFIKNNQSIRLSREIPAPVLTPASFDISSITFDAYNPRLSQTRLPTSTIPAILGQTLTSVVSVGASVQDWIIKVRDADITANLISFPDVVNIRAGIATTTASYVVTGLEKNVSFPANITSLNGGIIVDNIKPSVLSTQVQNGSIINLDTTSSIDYGTTKILDFAIGTATTTWKVITEPLDLSATFTFYEQTVERPGATSFRSLPSGDAPPLGSANLSTLYGTDGIGGYPLARFDIDGLNVGLATDITFTNGAEYNITRFGTLIKNFTDPPQRVINGDRIRVRLTSASTYSTTVTTTATVGTTSQQVWSITTQPDPTPPPIIPPPPPIIPPPPPIIPPPPPVAPTNLVGRYYNGTIQDHLYSTGNPITGGRLTVTDTLSSLTAPISITLSGDQNPFLGADDTAATVTRQAPTPTDPVIRLRFTLPYQAILTSVVLNSTVPSSGGGARITGASVTDEGFSTDLRCNVFFVRFTSTNASGRGYARDWSIGFDLRGYNIESSAYFRVFQTPQPNTQLLRTSYLNSRTNHEIAFSGDEESPGYNAVQNLGYAYPGSLPQPSGTIPLYKVVRRVTGDGYDTLVSTSVVEAQNLKNAGWTEISSFPGPTPGIIGRPYAWVLSP